MNEQLTNLLNINKSFFKVEATQITFKGLQVGKEALVNDFEAKNKENKSIEALLHLYSAAIDHVLNMIGRTCDIVEDVFRKEILEIIEKDRTLQVVFESEEYLTSFITNEKQLAFLTKKLPQILAFLQKQETFEQYERSKAGFLPHMPAQVNEMQLRQMILTNGMILKAFSGFYKQLKTESKSPPKVIPMVSFDFEQIARKALKIQAKKDVFEFKKELLPVFKEYAMEFYQHQLQCQQKTINFSTMSDILPFLERSLKDFNENLGNVKL